MHHHDPQHHHQSIGRPILREGISDNSHGNRRYTPLGNGPAFERDGCSTRRTLRLVRHIYVTLPKWRRRRRRILARAVRSGASASASVLIVRRRGRAAREPRRRRGELHRHLGRLNKPPLKTILSPDGDIIDCVHVSHQPAFDHPFLRNHTLQLRPAFHPGGLMQDDESKFKITASSGEKTKKPMTQLWHQSGESCPENTFPLGGQEAGLTEGQLF
uniref:Neprosin activation peptide domain-containing protein n=1 Tax=Ananas comosus var. bracteatus TaxID=296719 RepID=A0A6V7PAW1_ANACO|nr:unnamed protein product [Ananas comosus var. bracteatus]